ncbi:hypothetical protein B0I35DRAFT_484411 [Stachybotrys elegans]|uniref:DUF6536 domain-containing protein n=1 Tax=Stachybotrys elegans TaxID=80388 RepID=A0A8K0SFM2_9HYPO|nr:hypothetical protein B0I35DRAFT_484411 [Stachybotrys elegans]
MSGPAGPMHSEQELHWGSVENEAPLSRDRPDEQTRPLLEPEDGQLRRAARRSYDVNKAGKFPFARKEILGSYIPQLGLNTESFRSRMSKRSDMLRLQFGLTALIVVFNMAFMIWTWISYPPDGRGVGTFRLGNCDEIERINTGLHLVINILSSLFLGSGNYCMQVLVALLRQEMDRAHAKGHSFDISIPSIKNLRHIHWKLVSYSRAVATSDYNTATASWETAPVPALYTLVNYNPLGEWDLINGMQKHLSEDLIPLGHMDLSS